jgi:hypothetical protein
MVKETAGAGGGLGRLQKAREAKAVPHKAGGGSVSHMADGGDPPAASAPAPEGKMSHLDAVGAGLMDDVYGVARMVHAGMQYLDDARARLGGGSAISSDDKSNYENFVQKLKGRDADIDAHLPESEVFGAKIPTGKLARFAGQTAPSLATLPFGGGARAAAQIAERNAMAEAEAYSNMIRDMPGVREIVKAGARPQTLPALKAWATETMPNAAGVSAGMGGYGEGETPLEAVGHGYMAKLGAGALGSAVPGGALGAQVAGKVRAVKNIAGTVAGGVKKAAEDVGKVLKTPPE